MSLVLSGEKGEANSGHAVFQFLKEEEEGEKGVPICRICFCKGSRLWTSYMGKSQEDAKLLCTQKAVVPRQSQPIQDTSFHPCARAVGQVHRAEGGRPQAAVRRRLNQVHHAKAVGQEHRAAEGRLRDRQGKEPGQRSKEQEEPAGSIVRSVIFVYGHPEKTRSLSEGATSR